MPGSVNRTGGFASGRHETTPDTRRRRIGLTSPRLDDRGIGANHLVRVRWSQVADNVGRTWKSIGRLLNQVLSWLRNLMIDMPSERHVPESGTDTFNSRRFKNPTSIMFQRIIDAYRQRKRKQRSKLYRYTNRAVTLLGTAWLLLILFPHPLFAHSARVAEFNIYSDRPIPEEISDVIRDAGARLRQSEVFDEDETFSIFIAHDGWRRRLLNPRAVDAFGAGFVFTGNTILNRCDIADDICFNDRPKFNQRPLHAVIAHECTHHLLASRLGLVKYFCLPEWKNEGYCEYVAGGSSFDHDQGLRLLRTGRSVKSPSFKYLTFLLAVRSALDDRGMTTDELFVEDLDFESLLQSAVNGS
jgi:hypothetical protein